MASNSLDTNLIVHYLIGDIPGQRELVEELLSTPNTIHAIADLAISEAVYVFETHYRQSRPQIIEALDSFFARHGDVLDYNSKLINEVFPLYLSHPKLSFNDCCLSAYAEINHAEPLFTFDKKLATQAENAKLLQRTRD